MSTNQQAAEKSDDWRASVHQSSRNTEVQEISRVLAALEPGATSTSKLRLAMQFEDTVFKAASSFDDYKKKLSKRLKRLQKNYVPPTAQVSGGKSSISNKDAVWKELKRVYGEDIIYIVDHGDAAVKEIHRKYNEEKKTKSLKQHVAAVKSWARDLGLLEDNKADASTLSTDTIKRLNAQLEKHLETVRMHVVRYADPNEYMFQALKKRESDFYSRDEGATNAASDTLSKISSRVYQKVSQKLKQQWPSPGQLLEDSITGAHASVPLPTNKDQDQATNEIAALKYLSKLRAAPSVILGYMATSNKSHLNGKSTVADVHKEVMEGIEFVTKIMKEYQSLRREPEVALKDAWTKQLVAVEQGEAIDDALPPTKRQRLSTSPLSLRTKVLFTTNRTTPVSLLPELRRKRAELFRHYPNGTGAQVVLHFDDAITMTIYFSPLLVNLRARDKSQTGLQENYPPLHSGLSENETTLSVWGVSGNYSMLGRVIEERLRDASFRATQVLRQLFTLFTDGLSDFETEILEITALRDFLQLARKTYTANWKDDDI